MANLGTTVADSNKKKRGRVTGNTTVLGLSKTTWNNYHFGLRLFLIPQYCVNYF